MKKKCFLSWWPFCKMGVVVCSGFVILAFQIMSKNLCSFLLKDCIRVLLLRSLGCELHMHKQALEKTYSVHAQMYPYNSCNLLNILFDRAEPQHWKKIQLFRAFSLVTFVLQFYRQSSLMTGQFIIIRSQPLHVKQVSFMNHTGIL